VKDLRAAVETSDPAGLLDGDLAAFMAAALARLVRAAREFPAGLIWINVWQRRPMQACRTRQRSSR
jgi:hypothetical protein